RPLSCTGLMGLDRSRSPQMESLREVHAFIAKQPHRLFVFDAFGNGLQSEGVGQADDGSDDVEVGRAGCQVAYKLDVDLEEIEGKPLQVGEASESGAEVIEGQPA